MNKYFILLLLSTSVQAYVPTVESLFRHGSNPDISANGIALTMTVKKIHPGEKSTSVNDASLLQDEKEVDFYKIFFTRFAESLKLAQARYNSASFSEGSLQHKIYLGNYSPFSIKPSIEGAEKGIFIGVIQALAFNNGSLLLNYLKSLDIPVKLNNEIINREKIEFLADYKRYLILTGKDRNAKKTEENPLHPSDPNARERAQSIMSESMYTDQKQVKLTKENGAAAWLVTAGAFEAIFSFKERDLLSLRYKSQAGEFELICKDYWLANGAHSLPRFILVKTFTGEQYQVEVTNLRHYLEREEDMVKRLKNWDQILKGKESTESRPEFLL